MSAPYCLIYGEAYDDETCVDCSKPVVEEYTGARYVFVGRLDEGRLCTWCAEASGLCADLAHGLEALDSYVVRSATDPLQAAGAGLNVQQAVRQLLDERWLPLVLGMAA